MARLAFTTIGVLYEARTHPRSKGFVDRSPFVMQGAEACEGFVERNVQDLATGRNSWGEVVRPSFVPPEREAMVAQTLSLWSDLESVYAFAYSAPVHTEAMRLRAEWFHTPDHPNYAAWWVADDHKPGFGEAARRLDALHADGPSCEAFDFKRPFDAEGRPTRLDPVLVKAKAARNAAARAQA